MAFVACSLEKAPSYGLRGIPRIEDLDSKANEILHIPGDKREVVMKGCCRNHAVHDGQRQPLLLRGCGQMSPAFGDGFRNGQYAPGEPRTNVNIKPALQRGAPLADWKRRDALADFTNRHDAEKHAAFASVFEERRYARIGFFASEFGRDIGINQISLHRLISRPVSLSRSKSMLRPRNGANSSTMSFVSAGALGLTRSEEHTSELQ